MTLNDPKYDPKYDPITLNIHCPLCVISVAVEGNALACQLVILYRDTYTPYTPLLNFIL